MKKLKTLFSLIIILSLLTGCARNSTDSRRINVVCTVFPPYDFVRSITDDRVNLTMLLPPGSEAHSYEPTPQDIINVSNADILIMVGGESEAWVESILKSTDTSKMKIIKMLEEVSTVEEEIIEGMDNKSLEHHSHHAHGEHHEEHKEYDEHVWTSPKNAILITQAISNVLCGVNPENEKVYKANTQKYITELKKLNDEYKYIVRDSKRDTLIFGDRFPFRYLTDELKLKYFAAFPGCSSHTEPSISTVMFLIDKVRSEKIPTVFCVDYGDSRIADTIASETGASVKRLYSCHVISKKQFTEGETYISLMRKNAEAIKEALN